MPTSPTYHGLCPLHHVNLTGYYCKYMDAEKADVAQEMSIYEVVMSPL